MPLKSFKLVGEEGNISLRSLTRVSRRDFLSKRVRSDLAVLPSDAVVRPHEEYASQYTHMYLQSEATHISWYVRTLVRTPAETAPRRAAATTV